MIAFLLGCGPREAVAPADAPPAVEAPELKLAFATLPSGLEVAAIGPNVELTGPDGASLLVQVGDRSEYGIEVLALANEQRTAFESLEQGEFLGSRQLTTPFGEGGYARGRFVANDQRLEETRLYVVHPLENRLVTYVYTYPAAEDSAQRVQTLLELVGETEAFATSPTEPGT
jgi:hypothetical protein